MSDDVVGVLFLVGCLLCIWGACAALAREGRKPRCHRCYGPANEEHGLCEWCEAEERQ